MRQARGGTFINSVVISQARQDHNNISKVESKFTSVRISDIRSNNAYKSPDGVRLCWKGTSESCEKTHFWCEIAIFPFENEKILHSIILLLEFSNFKFTWFFIYCTFHCYLLMYFEFLFKTKRFLFKTMNKNETFTNPKNP